MDPITIIDKYYKDHHIARDILIRHSHAVATKAVAIAGYLGLKGKKLVFIYEAAILHDIGMYLTNAPEIGCYGELPYICHGYLGHNLLLKEGYKKHAKVCERHTGTGISKKEIIQRGLPIPERSMKPRSVEEKIICYADKFFSKNPDKLGVEKKPEKIIKKLRRHGEDKVIQFEEWHMAYNIPESPFD